MSTAVVDNKGLEAPSRFKTFMKNNMQLLLVTLALLVVLAFFSFAVPNFAFVNRDVSLVSSCSLPTRASWPWAPPSSSLLPVSTFPSVRV